METRTPKYLEVSERISQQIRTGALSEGAMPSVRSIAREHKVSLVTALRAIQVLRDTGVITTVERSGSFLVASTPAKLDRFVLWQRTTPGLWQRASIAVIQIGFEKMAKDARVQVQFEGMDVSPLATERDMRYEIQALRESGVGGMFFLPSRVSVEEMAFDERWLSACRRESFPLVLIERNLRGNSRPLEWDLVCSDDMQGGLQLTQHLLSLGRQRVGFVTGSPVSSHNNRIAGYVTALHRAGRWDGANELSVQTPLVIEEPAGVPSKVAYQRVVDWLLASRVDSVVCYQDYLAIGLIMELMTRGINVPDDIAIAGFDNLPVGNAFAIGVTTYGFPSEEIAREALRLLRDRMERPHRQPVTVVASGTVIIRDSTVRAPRSQPALS